MLDSRDLATTIPLRRPVAQFSAPPLADFEIVRFLGGGGMGVVFEGRHMQGGRVALKFLKHGVMRFDHARARLLREGQAMARLRHPNVVSLVEVGTVGDEVFIAMELVDGGTLRDWMREPHDWREIVDVFIAFGRGLAKAHALGLVHRDVNPSNVFLDRDGTPKLGDFGLALTRDEVLQLDDRTDLDDMVTLGTKLTSPGSVLGTPGYMAPEQVRGDRVDARSDQYAFCVSLHEALTGQQPDRAAPNLTIPRPLRKILSRGLSLHPHARFPSMNALSAALGRARQGRSPRWISRLCSPRASATTLTYGA